MNQVWSVEAQETAGSRRPKVSARADRMAVWRNVRPPGTRGGQWGLRLRPPGRPARAERRPGRKGQGGRHLSAPRMHSHQGDPACGRGRRRSTGRVAVRRPRQHRQDRPGRGGGVRRGRGRPAVQGPVRAGGRPEHRGDQRRGPPGVDRRTPGDRGGRSDPPGTVGGAGHRLLPSDPARADGGRRAHPDQRTRLAAGSAARVGHRAGRGRDRVRIRLGLAVVRSGGDDHRGAAPAAQWRGAGGIGGPGAGVSQAGPHGDHRDGDGGGGRRGGWRAADPGRGPDAGGRAAAGSRRSRPVLQRLGVRRGRRRAGSRVRHGRRTAGDFLPGVYAVGDLVAGLQLAHRGFAHGFFLAEDIAHRLGRVRPRRCR